MNWQVDMLEQSVTMLAPVGNKVSARFYEALFNQYPNLRPLFQGVSMGDQQEKLWGALNLTVQGFRNTGQFTKNLLALGWKHKAYGVRPEDYHAVQVTLLKVLKEFLGDAWTWQMDVAWSNALDEVSGIMLQGSERRPGPSFYQHRK